MNLIEVFERFPTHDSCIDFLENIRWQNKPRCVHCGSENVSRKKERKKVRRWNFYYGRWNCVKCKSTFSVLSGTILHKTKVPLQKWFLAINLVINAKKGISSLQLSRDLKLTQKTAWYMAQRIRKEMSNQDNVLLQGIIEADETYIGGKPRRRKDDDGNVPPPSKRGRGTKKTPVIGAVERGGKVMARVVTNLKNKDIKKFIDEVINPILFSIENKA